MMEVGSEMTMPKWSRAEQISTKAGSRSFLIPKPNIESNVFIIIILLSLLLVLHYHQLIVDS